MWHVWGEERTGTYGVLVGRPEGKRSLGRHGHRWEVNIEMDLEGTAWGVLTGLIWLRIGRGDRLLSTH